MNIKKKQISLINNLITGIGIITLGTIVVVGSINMYTKVINLFVYIFIIFGLSKLLNFILNKKIVRNKETLLTIILNIVLGVTMIIFPKIPLSILPLIFSLYLLFNSVVKFIEYIILKENELNLRFKYLFFSIIFFIISLIFLFYPLEKLNLFITIIGVYCLILGINKIYEFVVDLLTEKFKLKIKHKLKMTLPVFFEAFVPKKALIKINKFLDSMIDDNIKNEKSDLQIFIHLSNHGFNQFGHMDICFENKIYSYGNYDFKSRKLFTTVGDGVLFIANNKKKYIDFCIKNNKKTVVEFGIKLTEEQKTKFRKELDKVIKDTYKWNIDKTEKKVYSYKLYNATKCEFLKFNKGEYKTYFVMGVNCTYFADQIFTNSLSSLLKIGGIITPGTYYQYLDENYRKKNSVVISKIIYNKDTIGDKYVKNRK